jgi:hypothetical protein
MHILPGERYFDALFPEHHFNGTEKITFYIQADIEM